MALKDKLPTRKVSDIKRSRSWAIYGRSGAGKTTFAGTFPTPMLYLDIRDDGTESISDVKDVDVMSVNDWEDLQDVYLFLMKNPTKYKTVVWDTITQAQNLALESILAKKRKDTARVGDWGSLTRSEWGDASAMLKEKITNFRDLPMEVVFIAQERTSGGDDSEGSDDLLVPEVGPATMKSVAVHLNGSVSIIGHSFIRLRRQTIKKKNGKPVEKEETVYCLRIGPSPVYITKLRKPKKILPPDFVEDPTYKDIVEILAGNELGETRGGAGGSRR